jgi:hypothetical protein
MLGISSQREQHYKPLLLRLGIIAAMLGAASLLGFLMSGRNTSLVLMMLLGAFGLVAVLRHIELGIVAILLAGFFVRFRIPTGTASELVISLVIAVACIAIWIIRMMAVEKRLTLKPAPINLPLLAFMATIAVAWIWGRAFRDPLVHEAGHPLVSVTAGLVIALLPACLLLTTNNIRSVRWLKLLVGILLMEGLIALAVDLGARFGVGSMRTINTLMATNGLVRINTHGLLSMWCVAFAFAMALFNRRLHWALRTALLVYVGAWVYWGYFSRLIWVSGWVPAFVTIAVIAFLRSKRLFTILLLVMVLGAGRHYVQTALQGEMERSGETRWAAYQVNWRVTGKHLLFGTGPAGYASYYMSYFPTEAMATHNNYIDIVAQTGIIGTVFVLWFFAVQVRGNNQLRRQLQGRGDFAQSFSVAVLGGTAGCLVAMALGDWLIPFAYTQGIVGFDLAVFSWLFMGSLWALKYSLDSKGITNSNSKMTGMA